LALNHMTEDLTPMILLIVRIYLG